MSPGASENNSESAPKSSLDVPNNSETIPNALNMPEIEDESEIGRKRKYEETGIYGDISIRDIVLFRHIKGYHFPDLSADMRDWYEWMYFVFPVLGEKPFRGKSYEQHKRAYDRGRRWIEGYEASDGRAEAVGDSGATIIPFPRQATS